MLEARAPSSGTDAAHVAEGEADALALALAALASADAVEAAGRECRVEWCRDGDPNDELAAYLIERATIREFDGAATREEADRGA